MISKDLQLSTRFKLKDLIVTEQLLSSPNLPSTDIELDNLYKLASHLDDLWTYIGPFKIVSGFRTKELQAALTSKGDPTSLGTSFHELGRAADIVPTSMSLTEFFGKLLADPNLSSGYREIAFKPSQGALHLAIKTPDDMRETKVLGLDENKSYVRLTSDQIQNYISPYIKNIEEAVQISTQLVQENPMKAYIFAGSIFAIGLYLILKKK